jgi:putative ABC transport system permease protein
MLNDVRYAVRTLRRSPAFTVSAILALALGIGANTAVFSVVYAVLLKPLPYWQPDRLVALSEVNAAEGGDTGRVSRGTFIDWSARTHTLEGIGAYTEPGDGVTLWGSGDRYLPVRSSAVSASAFSILGVPPLLGRTFRPDDQRKLIISYGLWQRAFGGASDIVSRNITVEGRFTGEIIGVMPRGFGFPHDAEAWAHLGLTGPVPAAGRRTISYRTIARLAPGTTLENARRELAAISAQLSVDHPASNRGWTANVVPLAGSDTADVRPALLAMLAAVAAVLLIGCANVANLLLARASSRRREYAVRAALGAGTARLVGQCLTEALILAAFGTVAGLLLAQWLRGVLVRLAPPDIPRISEVHLNGAVLLCATAAGTVSALLIAIAPALQAARADHRGTLRPDSRGATARRLPVRRLLIGGEVAAVVLLLTGALLFVRTLVKLRGVDLGFESHRVINVSARWPTGAIFPSTRGIRPWPNIQRRVDGLIAAVSGVPGVEAAGLISDVPLTGDPFSGHVWRADAPGVSGLTPPADPRDRWKADLSIVTSGYFTAMGIPLLRGRNFSDADRLTDDQLNASYVPTSGAVIINNAFATRYLPGQDPVGRTLVFHDDQTFGWSRRIVGVVADVRGHAVAEAPVPAVFIPHAQHPDVFVPSIMVRSSLAIDLLAPAIRSRLAQLDPQLLVQRITPMDDVVTGALSRPRFNVLLLTSFASVALLLAAVGIYGVVAFLVTEQTREIGIRMALGARAADVMRLVLAEGMSPVIVGATAGIAGSLIGTRTLRTLLYGVTPLDAPSVAAAPAILVGVALLACVLPARRALRVDPLVALRDE